MWNADRVGAESGSAGSYPNIVSWTNDTNWTVVGRTLIPATNYSTFVTLASDYDPTDLNPTYQQVSTGCPSYAELCVHDDDYGNIGWFGLEDCVGSTSGSHPNMVCSKSRVRINLWGGLPPFVAISEYNLCHEIGHATALRHTLSDSCLKTYNDGGSSSYISIQDFVDINAHY